MDSKNKNILIGGLLAIVLIMAVGYAAFATQLQINGTATIDSNWNVHFDTTKTNTVQTVTGTNGTVAPQTTGTIVTGKTQTNAIDYTGDTVATVGVKMTQPGDSATWTLTIKNDGTLDAIAAAPTLTVEGAQGAQVTTISALEKQVGNIKYTVTAPADNILYGTNGSTPHQTTMTIKAEFVQPTTPAGQPSGNTGNVSIQETATATVTINYSQYTS